jgi:hypothetical protein
MIIFIRGHIRNSFDSQDLCDLVRQICNTEPSEIYIHTWSIFSSSLSYRSVAQDERPVTESIIRDYFIDLPIKHIMIDNDQEIDLVGTTAGTVSGSPCPLRAWKNMFYGKYVMLDYLSKHRDETEVVLNFRFDVLQNSTHEIKEKNILAVASCRPPKNQFIYPYCFPGVDNCYLGPIKTLHALVHHFHHRMDEIVARYSLKQCHEYIVFFENSRLGL